MNKNTTTNNLQTQTKELIVMLHVNGYSLSRCHNITPNTSVLLVDKHDSLGALIRYGIVLSSSSSKSSEFVSACSYATAQKCHVLKVCTNTTTENDILLYVDLSKRFGGPVSSSIILDPDLPAKLELLGHNKVPSDLAGNADDILENTVKDCLQYLFADRAHCYGQQRRFEKVPDGIAFGKKELVVLYDAKAYTNGFDIKADDIRRFSSYVTDFNSRYSTFIPPIYCFLVVSGSFSQGTMSLSNYSNNLYSECQTKLCFIKSSTLGQAVVEIQKQNVLRSTFNWKNILSKTIITMADINEEIARTIADNIT